MTRFHFLSAFVCWMRCCSLWRGRAWPKACWWMCASTIRSACRGRFRPPHAVPQPPSSYKIDAIEVNAKLDDQVARVQVSQTFENTGSVHDGSQLHVSAAVRRRDRPADAARRRQRISKPSCLSKEDARRRYEEIVRKNRDPALLEWVGTGHVPDERVPDSGRGEAHRHAPLFAIAAQELRPHRFHLSAEHGQVHERAGREAEHSTGD